MSTTIRLAERGHNTFDVYRGATFVGSVWGYYDGWVAFNRNYDAVSGYCDTPQSAAAVLL